MHDLRELRAGILALRRELHRLLDEKSVVLDDEIISVSKMLDAMLNEYEKVINKKDERKDM